MSDIPAAVMPRVWRGNPLDWFAKAPLTRAEEEALRRSREKLAEYDDHLLRDIGLTREQALAGTSRSAWNGRGWWKTQGR